MVDLLLTSALFLLLFFCVVWKARVHPGGNDAFFDKENSNAFRGIWCIIVILVHIPAQYGNPLQNMAGSFAYIGVTFYFLSSGYGLSLKGTQNGFWRKRLPKLLLPQLLINLCSVLLFWLLLGEKPNVLSFLWVVRWLRWLLACYLLLWLCHRLIKNKMVANSLVALGILALSISQYTLKNAGWITETIWPTEIFGFLWGILLAKLTAKFQQFGKEKWPVKAIILCAVALVLGALYLPGKNVVFLGDYLLKTALSLAVLAFLLFLNTKISLGNRALKFLGNISFEMYLSHTIVIRLVGELCPNTSSGLFIWLVLAGSFALSALIWQISKRILKSKM